MWSDEAGELSEWRPGQWEVTECIAGAFVGVQPRYGDSVNGVLL